MKKTLSVLLSLLMVVSCMTCLFTMPASAVEATSTEVVENLPDNLLKVTEGTEITLKEGVASSTYNFYQIDVEATIDEANISNKFFPKFFNADGAEMEVFNMVGVRYSPEATTDVITVYHSGKVKPDASKAADNAAGTYIYTYVVVFNNAVPASVQFPVAVKNANFFDLSGTDWNNFVWQPNVLFRYMVKEGNNVFQRFYGYRNVGDTAMAATNRTVSAKIGGDYYGFLLEKGKTYNIDFDIRYATNTTVTNEAPHYNVYETQFFDHIDEYRAIRDEMGYLESDLCSAAEKENPDAYIFGYQTVKYKTPDVTGAGRYDKDNTTLYSQYYSNASFYVDKGQVMLNTNMNGYVTGTWNTTSASGFFRRTGFTNVATLKLTDADGVTIPGAINATTSSTGREYYNTTNSGKANNLKSKAGQWVDATYTVNGKGAEDVKTGYKNLQYPEKSLLTVDKTTNEWATVNPVSGNPSRIAPTTDDATVAFGIESIKSGCVYDFDNFAISTTDNEIVIPGVKGQNPNGKIVPIPAPDNTTSVTVGNIVDLVNDTFTATFEYDATREAYGNFVGWYCGDELISTSKTAALPYSTYKADPTSVYAVVEYENYLGNAGGLEGYAKDKNMSPPSESITIGGTTYKPYTSLPTGDYWGVYAWSTKLPSGTAYDPEVNPYITELGIYGDTGRQAYAAESFTNSGLTIKPYKGTRMLKTYANDRNVIKAIEGLTPGKAYKISFYANSAIQGRQVYAAAVVNNVLDVVNANTLATSEAITNRGTKILTTEYTSADKTCFNEWVRYELYFTATQEIEFLFLRESGFNVCYDEFVCKEYTTDITGWDFEDGSTEGIRSTSDRIADNQAGVVTVENNTDYADITKLGNKYLKYSMPNGRWNSYLAFNFNYDNDYRYKVSFDFKVIKYAPSNEVQYGEDLNGQAATHANYMKDTFHYQSIDTTISQFEDGNFIFASAKLKSILSKNNTNITRYYENGKTYPYSFKLTHDNVNYFTTVASRTVTVDDPANTMGYEYTKFADTSRIGGDLWDGWTRWEIEIDPSTVDYDGLVTLGFNFTGKYAEYGIDNVKIQKVANTEIEALSSKLNATYAFNIRSRENEKNLPQGLRFKSSIDLGALGLIENDQDAIGGTFANGSKIVEYGTLAANYHYYDEEFVMKREQAKDMSKDGWIIAGVAYKSGTNTDIRYSYENGVVTYTGVLVGIDIWNYDTPFAVCAYVIIEDANGVRTTIYGDVVNGGNTAQQGGGLSFIGAANAVVANPKNEDDAKTAQQVIDEYNAANNQ